MNIDKDQPIVIIEDDTDDQELLRHMCKHIDIKNELVIFNNAPEAYDYLVTTRKKTFIILCDINLPMMDGIELRNKIEENPYLKQKSIPFVFLTTGATKAQVSKAYQLSVQGLFFKATSLKEFERKLRIIFQYWAECKTPSSVY